jgi:hypothetical protein
MSLVDLGDRKACDQASYPDEDPSLALSKVTGAAGRTTVLNDHGEHNPIAEVADFLDRELQRLVHDEPIPKEAANGRPPLEAVSATVDRRLALEALIAPLHFRTLVTEEPPEDALPHQLADLVLDGIRGSGHWRSLDDLANNPCLRNRSPKATVVGVFAGIAHQEPLASWDPDRGGEVA